MSNEKLEVEPAPLVCPRCNQEFDYVEDQQEYTCQKCGIPVDNIQAQFAYCRGYDAFFAGQQVLMEIPPNRRSRQAYAKQTHDVTQLFTEAYTAIQVAFQTDLAESQQYKAIEMMASIANLFMQKELISPLETNYWTSLMIEQVNLKEYEDIKQKLSQPTLGIFALLKRWNWRRRKRLFEKGLAKLEKRIHLIEQNIFFATPPRVRKEPEGSMGINHA